MSSQPQSVHNKLKIVLLQKSNPFFSSSASANRTRSLIQGLEQLGVEILICITAGYQSVLERNKMGRQGKTGNIRYLYLSEYHSDNIWRKRINTYLLSPIKSLFVVYTLKKIINTNPESIIWPTTDLTHLKAVTQINNKKFFSFIEISEYGDIYKYHAGNILQKYLAKRGFHYFEKKAYYSLDAMALMTKTLVKHYYEYPQPGPKLLHLPMTVDLDRFDLNRTYPLYEDLKKPYVAFIGDMNNFKDGVDILINSFAKIADEFPHINLYLFGFYFYDLPGHLEQIKNYKLKNRIIYKGTVGRDVIPDIIMNASLLVLSRPDSKQAQGGFPTKLGEYLATGNPVCVTKVGEIPDYLEDGVSAFLAEPGSVESFADSMRRALEYPENSKMVGMNGRLIAEKYFNKDIQAKILYDFFQTGQNNLELMNSTKLGSSHVEE